MSNNFSWLKEDIFKSLILKVYVCDNGTKKMVDYDIGEVLSTDLGSLDIKNGNIDDLRRLLGMSIVRFYPAIRENGIGNIDIYLSKMIDLYDMATDIVRGRSGSNILFDDVVVFSVTKGEFIASFVIDKPSDDLLTVLHASNKMVNGVLGMQEEHDLLTLINDINYQRLRKDKLSGKH